MVSRPYGDLRVLVTGARGPLRAEQEAYVRQMLGRATNDALMAGRTVVLVQGRCPRGGVDLVAEIWAESTPGVTNEPHPADWDTYGPAAGPMRNTEMVNLGADICLAFPGPRSTGTWDCLKKAARAGIIGRVYPI